MRGGPDTGPPDHGSLGQIPMLTVKSQLVRNERMPAVTVTGEAPLLNGGRREEVEHQYRLGCLGSVYVFARACVRSCVCNCVLLDASAQVASSRNQAFILTSILTIPNLTVLFTDAQCLVVGRNYCIGYNIQANKRNISRPIQRLQEYLIHVILGLHCMEISS